MNRKYVFLPNDGPDWIAAYQPDIVIAEIEENLKLTPWERLLKNDRKLNYLRSREALRLKKNQKTNL
ncbi:MAG: hypothetical protein ABIQ35_04610 [Verrucomicrobiota bacterium]